MVTLDAGLAELSREAVPPARLAAKYVFVHLKARHGRQWLGSRQQGRAKLEGAADGRHWFDRPLEVLSTYQLKGVGGDSHAGLTGWLEDRYPLVFRHDIPSPREMLDIQCDGRRFVTIMLEPHRQFQAYGRHAGAFEFLLHDLEHAHKYFGNTTVAHGQRRFFLCLRAHLEVLQPFLKQRQFQQEIDYLMSDMNSHPVHLVKYFKAIVLNALIRGGQEELWDQFCGGIFERWNLTGSAHAAAIRINHPGRESEADRRLVSDWFLTTL